MAGRIVPKDIPRLSPQQMKALQERSPSPDDILAHMNELNEEIEEQAEAEGVELVKEATPDPDPTGEPLRIQDMKPLVGGPDDEIYPENDLDALNAKLERELELKRAAEAAEAQAQAEQQTSAPEADEGPDIQTQVINMLKDSPNAPSDLQIARWKQEFGEAGVQVVALGQGDVYVFTYLRRTAFQKIQAAMTKKQSIDPNHDPEEFMMEQVVKSCILWPRPLTVEFFHNSRSGVIPTLYGAVMLHSYHLTPQQAMVLTAQL